MHKMHTCELVRNWGMGQMKLIERLGELSVKSNWNRSQSVQTCMKVQIEVKSEVESNWIRSDLEAKPKWHRGETESGIEVKLRWDRYKIKVISKWSPRVPHGHFLFIFKVMSVSFSVLFRCYFDATFNVTSTSLRYHTTFDFQFRATFDFTSTSRRIHARTKRNNFPAPPLYANIPSIYVIYNIIIFM